VRTLGVDLASDPRRTALCLLDWRAGGARLVELTVGADDERILAARNGADVTGIDSPFGWPAPFVGFLCSAARLLPELGEPWDHEVRDGLRYRATDRAVREAVGRWPLSVSSDLIAVVAMRCVGLLTRMGVSDRAGGDGVFEVYPAAALARWGLGNRGYKGRAARPRRVALLRSLARRAPWLDLGTKAQRALLADSADAFDALIAALNARAAALGHTEPPAAELRREAAREGWIALPVSGSLERLAGGRAVRPGGRPR
jgi:predicted nuclease with RNAse H fold